MGAGTRGLAVLALLWAVSAQGQPWWVRGAVVDAATGEPLPAATLRLAGTFRGTIANDEGEYRIEVRSWPATLRVSHIGYASRDTLLTAPPERVDFALVPAPYPLEPLVVTPGDPAESIMARVIRNKQVWRPLLASYRARAYTRRVLENDEGIVTIGETGSEIFWDRDRGLREVVRSRRTTRNLDAQSTYASALEGFVDFYDDDIPMAGHTLVGPTHPEALDHYRFRLAGRRYLDDRVVYDISVEPRSRLAAAFSGRVSVLDGDFVLLEAELAPSRAVLASVVPLPVLERLDVSWRQQFRGFGEVWLPVDQRFAMEVEVGIVGLRFPPVAFASLTRLDDCEVNVDLPDSLYAGEEVLRVDSVAVARDSTFAGLADKVPLSEREREAYATIDSTLRLERAFRPSGFLARLLIREMEEEEAERERAAPPPETGQGPVRRRGPGIDWKPDLLYDRVGGAHLGLAGSRRWQAPRQEAAPGTTRVWSPGPGGPGLAGLEAGGGGAWDLGLKRGSWRGHAAWGWEKEERTTTTTPGRTLAQSRVTTRLRVDLEYGSGKAPRSPSDSYTPLLNSAQALLGLDDYFDWYWREGLRARLRLWLPGRTALEAGLRDEDHSSLAETTSFNLPWRDWRPRPNPPVDEGRLRSLEARFEWGGPYRPFGLRANRRLEVKVEHGGLGGDFSFTRLHLALDGHVETFLRRRSAPNALDLRLVAGHAFGRVPVQRFGALGAAMLPFSPFGVFRTVGGHPLEGEHHAALYWEHNFRGVPFELLGLWDWAMRGAGLVAHGASGRTWIDPDRLAGLGYDPRYEDGFRHEAGLSLVLFHLLRLDLTRRLDRSGWSAGASLARFDAGIFGG